MWKGTTGRRQQLGDLRQVTIRKLQGRLLVSRRERDGRIMECAFGVGAGVPLWERMGSQGGAVVR